MRPNILVLNYPLPCVYRGYKVIWNDGNTLTSAMTGLRGIALLPKKLAVEYKVGERTYPRSTCGPLAVFKTLTEAHSWLENYYYSGEPVGKEAEIWRCVYGYSDALAIWDNLLPIPYSLSRENLPEGSDLARWVTLLRKVEPNEPETP